MSRKSALKFMENAYNDEEFQAELKTLTTVDDIVSRAAEAGYEFTSEELQEAAPAFYEEHDIELSDEDLEDAAGGVVVATIVKAK